MICFNAMIHFLVMAIFFTTDVRFSASVPTSQPSLQPSGQPSSSPSGEPSIQLTGNPSPSPSNGPSSPSRYPSSAPSCLPSNPPSGEPSNQPTGEPSVPSGLPSSSPSLFPMQNPFGMPTNSPSIKPSGPSCQPTGFPSHKPSSAPSGQPSSHPTHPHIDLLTYEGGGNNTSPVTWYVSNLGFADNNNALFLSVDVYPTNYENMANQYATVKVNEFIVLLYCTPDVSCGSDWYPCVTDLDIANHRLESLGGSLSVEVSNTGVNSGPCDYQSYSLYTRMNLRSTLPSNEPTSEPSSMPSVEPSTAPTNRPSMLPSFMPTSAPTFLATDIPSSQPTTEPTVKPSTQPSSAPTIMSPFLVEACGGGNDTHPVELELLQLGYSNRSEPLYLSVSVYPTNFEVKGTQWATVRVNSEVVINYCVPDESCGGKLHYCMSNIDVRNLVQSASGGKLKISVSSTGVNSGPCNHDGFSLYACAQLGDYILSSSNTHRYNIWVVGSLGVLITIVFFIFICYCNTSMKYSSKSMVYAVTHEIQRGNMDSADVEGNFQSRRMLSPSGRRPPQSTNDNDFSARRLKLQASNRFNKDDEEGPPLRPLRGSSRQKRDGNCDDFDDPERMGKALELSRRVVKTKKYSFDGF